MSQTGFVHLHAHSHYSLLDGSMRIDEMLARTRELEMDALALTDHGNLFGAIEFYTTALKTGVKPILGCEMYLAPGDRREKTTGGMSEAAFHLVLLAANLKGYRNLLHLASEAYLTGFYYRPRIDRELLAACSEGLVCINGHLGTDIATAAMGGDLDRARELVRWYRDAFGPDRFYLELQRHGQPDQDHVGAVLIDLAAQLDVPLVATQDVHYLRKEDAFVQEVMICINTGKTLDDPGRMKMETDEFYFKSPAQMRELFADVPEAVANTRRIADLCNVDLDLKARHAPVFTPPEGKSAEEYLRELVHDGARRKYGEVSDELRQRIDYELHVIGSKGFASYFLICWDLVRFARSRGIPCGARGSGCSSVVGYCLDISAPDPLRYGLYFERFMDPDRDEMPDIDVDMCQDGRAEVIEYVRRKYGHVAQVITFGTLKARAAVRDVCRVLGVPLADADRLAKLIPAELKMTIDKALAQEPEIRRLYDADERSRQVLDIARRLEGLARHASVHAAAVVIADQPLDRFVPLCRQTGSDAVITQFEWSTVEKVGLLKMDFLGLRTLTTLERACQLVRANHGVEVDLDAVPLDDPAVYALFANGQTRGIFQFESAGMQDVLAKMQPNRIEDLIAANALYRPGAMTNIDAYVARKHGERWTTAHPVMTEVLAETYGIIVYQEQVSRVVNRLGGIELKRAFRLAKAISKKNVDMIEAERQPFIDGAQAHGVDAATAETIFDNIRQFGGYGFNKAHSTGYALVAYRTAYLKVHYPLEFTAAWLTYEIPAEKPENRAAYLDECRRMGIEVRPPDINTSFADFTVVYPPRGAGDNRSRRRRNGNTPFIRFGLASIKGVGHRAVEHVVAVRREGGEFKSLFDFCERVDHAAVNRAVIEGLIRCGAFDSTGARRKAMVDALDRALQMGAAAQQDRRDGQLNMFEVFEAGGDADDTTRLPDDEWSEPELLAAEKATLGFYVTSHPLASHSELLANFASAATVDLAAFRDGEEVVVGGMIAGVRRQTIKTGRSAGRTMAFVSLEDLKGHLEVVVFPDDLEKHRDRLIPERIVFVRGKVDRRRETPSLRADEFIDLPHVVERLATSVLLRVNCVGTRPELLDEIKQALDDHRGGCPVYLELTTGGGLAVTMRCNNGTAVTPNDDFVRRMDALLGPGHCTVIGPPRRTRPAATPVAPVPEDIELDAVEADVDVLV